MTDKQRTDFEAWHGGRYRGLQEDIAYAAWTASRKLALEEAAASCAGMLDEKAEARALRASRDATGTPEELSRLKHWMTVSTYNAGIRRCIAAVMDAGQQQEGQKG